MTVWRWLEENHPIIYEMVYWIMLVLAIAALVITALPHN